ncbi:MAG: transglutaminase domain-containing protein, partial [Phaeodactylibacter sp.]|nr:transglutaminase domain-containing protein [Phaeodactylibacter sp.]
TRLDKNRYRPIPAIISDYESDGIFHSDIKLHLIEYVLREEGQSVEIHYQKVFRDFKMYDPLFFNERYPVEKSRIEIVVPDWLSLDLREINFDLEKPIKTVSEKEGEQVISYELTNLTNIFQFKKVPRRNAFNAHLIVLPKELKLDGQVQPLMQDIDFLYGWYASLVREIGNDPAGLDALVAGILDGQESDLDKIKAIFYWVQDNIRYIAFENGIMGFRPESCQNVFNNKYGDCKGMANLTKEMLKIAGYDARLTWLGTSDLPYTYEIPSPLVDNHMICTVVLAGEKIFLDPTEKFADLYNYAQRIQGQEVLIENGAGFIIEKVPSNTPKQNTEWKQAQLSLADGQLVGDASITFTGTRKTRIFQLLSSIAQKEWKEALSYYLMGKSDNLEVDVHDLPNSKQRDDNIELNYSLIAKNYVIDLGNELYVNLETDHFLDDEAIEASRDVPYELSWNYTRGAQTSLTIPAGWKVDYLPEAVHVDQEKYAFDLDWEVSEHAITYRKSFRMKAPYLNPDEFDAWNQHVQQLKTFYADQIILSKK